MTLLSVSMLIFIFTELVPGDAASVLLGQQATPEALANLRKKLGLDRPYHVRYLNWLAGWPKSEGAVFRSRDGGEDWDRLRGGTAEVIKETFFLTPKQGWAISPGRIYVSGDAGTRWNRQFRSPESLASIMFADESNGLAVAAAGAIYRTTVGGVPGVDPESQGEREVFTWLPVDSGTTAALTDVYFAGAGKGWVSGTGGTILVTEDGGQSWKAAETGTEASLSAISFAPAAGLGVAVGDGGTILMTGDGGASWRQPAASTEANLHDVEFVGAATVWVVGDDGTTLYSTDGGATWSERDIGAPEGTGLRDVSFDGPAGAITGTGGLVATTVDGGASWTLQEVILKLNDGTTELATQPFSNVAVRVTPTGDISMWATSVNTKWEWGLVGGDFGLSPRTGDSINRMIGQALPASMLLAGIAFVVSVPTSLAVGIIVGLRPDSFLDRVLSQGSIFIISFPDFVTGIILMMILAAWLDLVPASSLMLPGETVLTRPSVLILPTLTVTAALFAYVMRMARANVLEVMGSPYVRTAILKGIPMRRVVIRHVLPNALLPTITVIANNTAWMFGGLAIIESVFAYPGVGRMLLSAISNRDVRLIQGTALVIASVTVFSNLAADLMYGVLDPRIKLA